MRVGTGRKNPRSCERKAAGADKLVRYLERRNRKDPQQYTKNPDKCATIDVKERRKLLFAKLESLQKEKEALMETDGDSKSECQRKTRRREMNGDVINIQIMETLQIIDELESEDDTCR
jgi:hypothetical protein